MASIDSALASYLDSIKTSRSPHTARTYANAAKSFRVVLKKHNVDVATTPTADLNEDAITWLVKYLKDLSPATEQLYVQAMAGFYEYVAAERLAAVEVGRGVLAEQAAHRRRR